MFGWAQSLIAQAAGRSPDWPDVRRAFLASHPRCEACGTRKKVEAHHVVPFHLDPSRELQHSNLIALCRTHHLTHGHLMLWVSWNPDVRKMVAEYRNAVNGRPRKPVTPSQDGM